MTGVQTCALPIYSNNLQGHFLVVVVVVITRHGGVATFAEAASKLQSQDTETQGTFQVEKEWYQSGKVAEAMEGTIV